MLPICKEFEQDSIFKDLKFFHSTNTTFQTAGTASPRVRVTLLPLGPVLELGNTNLASMISPSLLMLYEGTLATSWWWKWWWMWKLNIFTFTL